MDVVVVGELCGVGVRNVINEVFAPLRWKAVYVLLEGVHVLGQGMVMRKADGGIVVASGRHGWRFWICVLLGELVFIFFSF
jgi:hypothetical protein